MDYVAVGQGVVDRFALPAEFDQFAVFQHPELMGYGALGDLHQLGDVADAQLGLEEGVQNLHPGAVAEDFEQLGQVVKPLVGGEVLPDPVHRGVVDQGLLTAWDGSQFHRGLPFYI